MAENTIIHNRKLTIEQKNIMIEVTVVWVVVRKKERGK
jgi:hypothetical protein